MSKRWAGIARLGGIGDNLMAASALRPLKRLGYMTEVITSEPYHVVFHHNPFIDKLSVKVPERDLPQGDAWHAWFAGRAKEFDIFANLSHSCEARHAMFPGTTPFWWRPEYRRKLCAGSYLETVHDILCVPHEFGPLFFTSEDERVVAAETKAKMGDKVIGWALAGSRIDKVYPYAPMIIARMIKELGLPVFMAGVGGKQFTMAESVMKDVERTNSSVKDLHLGLSPAEVVPGEDKHWPARRVLSQLHFCDLVISPDTGTAWAVAMEPIPKVIMVSHASVENITKHWINTITLHADPNAVPCWPCHRLHSDTSTCVENKDHNGAACISDISVECLFTAVRAQLGSREALKELVSRWPANVTLSPDIKYEQPKLEEPPRVADDVKVIPKPVEHVIRGNGGDGHWPAGLG